VTARWGSGPRCRRCSAPRGCSAAGCTRSRCLGALSTRLSSDAKAALPTTTPRDPRRRGRRRTAVRGRLRLPPQGGRQDHRRPRRVVDVLRLPGRALEASANHQRRVDVRDRAAAATHHHGARLPRRGTRDCLQAARRRPSPLAPRQRPRVRRTRPRWRDAHR
jgi:hypothetical protein